MKKVRSLKERICALIIALVMPMTSILPNMAMTVQAAADQSATVDFYVYEMVGTDKKPISGAKVKIYEEGKANDPLLQIQTNEDGSFDKVQTVAYDAAAKYFYSVTKSGYTDKADKEIDFSKFTGANSKQEVEISMEAIALSSTEVFLNKTKGETAVVTIKNKIGDGSSYQWTSDKEDVATVDGTGKITAVGRGKAIITVSRSDQSATVTVTVKEELTNMTLNAAPGTESEPNKSEDGVTLSVDGMAQAADSVELYIIRKDKEEKIGEATKANGYKLTYTNADKLKGKVTFVAKYNPTSDYYYAKEARTTEISYKKTAKLNLTESGKTITYGDTAPTIGVQNDLGRDLSYSSNNTNVATVDGKGALTIVGEGTAVITITAAATDEYFSDAITYTLTVNKKKVEIALKDITWQPASKVYDGGRTVEVKGEWKNASGDTITIPVTAELEKADTGSYTTAKVSKIGAYETENPNYQITLSDLVNPDPDKNIEGSVLDVKTEVTPRPVYIQVKKDAGRDFEAQASYGSDPAATIEGVQLELAGTNGRVNDKEEQGLVGDETLDLTKYAKVTLKAGTYYVGTHTDAIQPIVTMKEAGNYTIHVDEENISTYSGRLQVVQQKVADADVWSKVQINEADSTNYHKQNGIIWVNRTGKLVFYSTDMNYDLVSVKKDGDTGYANSLIFENFKEGENAVLTGASIYLSKEGQTNTRTTSGDTANMDNQIPADAIKVDSKLPEVSFDALGGWRYADSKLLIKALAKAEYNVTIRANDDGSGLSDKVSYKLVSVTSDETAADTITEAANAAEGWTALTMTDAGATVTVPKTKEGGYYVVLVKAIDNVGNSVVSASNGIVIDVTNPSVTIDLPRPADGVFGSEGADYTVEVNEPGTVISGIDHIEVKVTTSSNKEVAGDAQKHEDSYILEETALNALKAVENSSEGYTIAELKAKTNYTIAGSITAACGTDNKVKLTVTAYDKAGNFMADAEEELTFDITAPEVSVSYDNNTPVTSDDTGNYYQSRTMTIEYKERNFDSSKTSFDLTVNGVKQEGITIDSLGTVEGITVKSHVDSEETPGENGYTDERTNTYVVEFGEANKEFAYEITPGIVDKAGNTNTTVTYADGTDEKSKAAFIVDKKAPEVAVAFTDKTEPKNDKYYNQPRIMTVTYKEQYYDAAKAMVQAVVNGTESEKSITGFADAANAIAVGTETKEGNNHSYKVTFGADKKDVDYDILPSITDKAGNTNLNAEGKPVVAYTDAQANPQVFTVDMVAPVIDVTYETTDNLKQDVTAKIGTKVQDSMYQNQDVNAVISITERNFCTQKKVFTELKLTEEAKKATGAPIGKEEEEKLVKAHAQAVEAADKWEADKINANLYHQTLAYTTDANYSVALEYKDLAGNAAKYDTHYFTVDKVAPTVEMKVEEIWFYKFLETITFGFFENMADSTYISTTIYDDISPVRTDYYKYYPGVDARGEFEGLAKEELLQLDEDKWNPLSKVTVDGEDEAIYEVVNPKKQYQYGIELSEQIVPYERVQDKAGNIAYMNADGIICEDKEAMISVDIDTEAPKTSFAVKPEDVVYNSDVDFTIKVSDTDEKVYSGLKEVYYEIRNNGEVTQSGNYNDELTDSTARVESLTKSETIKAALNNSNNVQIFVKAVDYSGNEAEYTKDLMIDITKPQITVTYDKNADDVKNQKYFNSDRTMTIEYQERNINLEGITYDFKAGEKDYGRITLAELKRAASEAGLEIKTTDTQEGVEPKALTNDRVMTCTITFNGGKEKDLDYEIIPYIEDQASNTIAEGADIYDKDAVARQSFTVDKVKPTMVVKYYLVKGTGDGETLEEIPVSADEINRLYKNQTVRAIVTIDERNFSGKEAFSEEYQQVTPDFNWKCHDGSMGSVAAYEEASKTLENWSTDAKKPTIRTQAFDFIADGDYSFSLKYVDMAGNELEKAYPLHYVTIDKTAPKVSVSYEADNQPISQAELETIQNSKVGWFQQHTIRAIVTIDERNFERENQDAQFEGQQMKLSYTAVDSKGKKVKVTDYAKDANTREKWTPEGYVRTQTFTFDTDANYNISLTYKDLAGNECSFGPQKFTVDKTAPTGSIQIRETIWNKPVLSKLIKLVTFGFFNNQSEKVTLTSDDATAGVASTQYYKYVPAVESRNEFKALTWEDLEKITEWTDISSGDAFTLKDEGQTIVYEKIVDRAGNVTYINSEEGVIIDKTNPAKPVITITTAKPAQDIYAGDVNFTMQITDPVSGGTYAGLKEVYYEVRNNGVVTQSGNYNSELSDHTARIQSLTKHEKVAASLNNSNFVQIYVKAVDYAGNTSDATENLKIDITKPVVKITFDLNNPSNGKYYNATRTATVTVTERNFDPNAVRFTITNTDGTQPSISGWTSDSRAGISDECVNTCRVTFSADGDYNMSMNCTDKAGNVSNTDTVQEFTIDKTVPTINVSFDNNSAANGRYYNAPRTATITVVEHNFNGSEVRTAINAALQSQGITAPGVNGWSGSGDSHSATVHFGADGDYSFTVNYTDLAGNAAQAYNVEMFTIDQTKPVIEIFDIEDKSANNDVVAPGVRYSDVNYDVAGVSITIDGWKHQSTGIDGARSSIPNGESIKMADFEHTESVDDVYTLTAKVTDFAGNFDEQKVIFSVNRFGSNYLVSDYKEYSNQEADLTITEINVDTLERYDLAYTRDGDLVNLEKDTDYTVKASGSEATWKEYAYTIKAKNFEQEGRYNVTIDSKDRATNETNNKVKDVDVEFVIDKTAPTVVITGVEDDGRYKMAERDIVVAVSDNVLMDYVELYEDSGDKPERLKIAKAEEIFDQSGKISYTLESSTDRQYLRGVAVDAAGNKAETVPMKKGVLVTANAFVQFYNNTPLLIATCVGLAAVVGFFIFLLAKRRKKDEEEAKG